MDQENSEWKECLHEHCQQLVNKDVIPYPNGQLRGQKLCNCCKQFQTRRMIIAEIEKELLKIKEIEVMAKGIISQKETEKTIT